METLSTFLTEGRFLKHTKDGVLDQMQACIEATEDIRGAGLNAEERDLTIFMQVIGQQ